MSFVLQDPLTRTWTIAIVAETTLGFPVAKKSLPGRWWRCDALSGAVLYSFVTRHWTRRPWGPFCPMPGISCQRYTIMFLNRVLCCLLQWLKKQQAWGSKYRKCRINTVGKTDSRLSKGIGVNRPAFGGTVPHFHQMSRGPAKSADVPHFLKIVLLFCSLPIILHVCLATQHSDELRIKIGNYRFKIRTPTDHWL